MVYHISFQFNTTCSLARKKNRKYIRGSKKFCQRGSKFEKFFFLFTVDGGGGGRVEYINTAINGPASARQRIAIEMAFRWRADAGTTLNDDLVAL